MQQVTARGEHATTMVREPSESTLSTFTASDGDNLALQDWPLPEGEASAAR